MSASLTKAEELAIAAEDLPAFQGFKLLNLRNKLQEVLNFFGRQGLFEEYTKHDLSHVDEMLRIYAWLIPDNTKSQMSPADWLMLVSATYLHDVGLIVTRTEYDDRANSAFPTYCEAAQNSQDVEDREYGAYLKSLLPEDREKFLYQEFVREHHAARIRSWLSDAPDASVGFDPELVKELKALSSGLDPFFVADLGLVCESHHRDDLYDTEKYPYSCPYGNSDEETANVQYAAICLRAADLLHITRERAPSIAWKLINPNNPASQREWAKQSAVRRVKAQRGYNREGKQDPAAAKDTIEVHAEFSDPEGFFGLIGYLAVAEKELQSCHSWAANSNVNHATNMEFPWRYIDKTHVQASGFMSKKFSFTFDEGKILDLLTGHTLYNDPSVVVRETLQNALDAVRLQRMVGNCDCSPEVQVNWNSAAQLLEVIDNGTGMTLDIIEENFLRVGSSRYQENNFRRQHPDFAPISRFGIGVLSAFMISDEVQVITCTPTEQSAREISLRSVHGQYLIRMIPRSEVQVPELIKCDGHGTVIRIRARRSADLSDVLVIIRKWLVLPRARVVFTKDDDPPIEVGFPDLKAALRAMLIGLDEVEEDGENLLTRWGNPIEIRGGKSEDLEVAYTVSWSPFLQEWSFWGPAGLNAENKASQESIESQLGICIEGIRVEPGCPGVPRGKVAAIANATGKGSPRTNVARTALERTIELEEFLLALYRAYCKHLIDEGAETVIERGFSVTKAANQVQYLVRPISEIHSIGGSSSNGLFLQALREVPAFVIEHCGSRVLLSMRDIEQIGNFITYDSIMIRRLESLLATVPGTVTLDALGKLAASADISKLATDAHRLSAGNAGIFARLFRSEWEPESIDADEHGLLSVKWKRLGSDRSSALWWADELSDGRDVASGLVRRFLMQVRRLTERFNHGFADYIFVPKNPVALAGLDNYDGVVIGRDLYVLPGSPILDWPFKDAVSEYERLVLVTSIARLLPMTDNVDVFRSVVGKQTSELLEQITQGEIARELFADEVRSVFDYRIRIYDVGRYDRRYI